MLTESISLSKYYGELVGTIKKSVETALNDASYTNNLKSLRTSVSDNLLGEFHDSLSFACSNIVGKDIKVYFDPDMTASGDSGSAYDNEIILNERKYIDYISITAIKYINKSVDELFNDVNMKKLIHSLASTLIHELVHIHQHATQSGDFEYRSYLDKKNRPNLKTLSSSGSSDSEYHRLYYASPQEISAFSHNIVLDILRDNGLTLNYNSLRLEEIPNIYSLALLIPQYVEKYIKPLTPREKMIYHRYIKLSYKELDRTLDYLRNRAK